jgi:DNA-binding MarR family transcriptional regulator
MARPPLPTLLSHALVAFTIEFDNEAEHRLSHRTTNHGLSKHTASEDDFYAPWLVSMVMWFNCLRFVDEKGITLAELESLARTFTNLLGMERWGYVVVEPNPADTRSKPPRSSWLIRTTPAGRKAQEVWRPLFEMIEKRWQERFGHREIAALKKSLHEILLQLDPALPDCLPILGYGLCTTLATNTPVRKQTRPAPSPDAGNTDLPLPVLLAKPLLAFALEFEAESELSLAICANVLRLVGEEGVRVRDLPRLSAVSKEAIAIATSFLSKRGYAQVKPESPGSRVKALVLTAKGKRAQNTYRELLQKIEDRWQERHGKDAMRAVRQSLERLVGEPTAESSPLFQGLSPYPDGWRAVVPKPEGLPHYPMVSHRGGYPDGS